VLKYSDQLDQLFQALADPTRRQLVERLGRGERSVSDLAAPLSMSLPAVMQHLHALERCGIVRSEKAGRVRTCRLEPDALQPALDWVAQRRREWENRLDRLDTYLEQTDPKRRNS
jgi:DNA-binding transcriptional ArsR family regulator